MSIASEMFWTIPHFVCISLGLGQAGKSVATKKQAVCYESYVCIHTHGGKCTPIVATGHGSILVSGNEIERQYRETCCDL